MINIDNIKKLRDKTLCGFKDCKEALEEACGDLEEAVQILKKRGLKVANKRSANETKEGIVIASVSKDRKYSAVVSLLCETDFVAKNDEFKSCADNIIKLAVDNKIKNLDELNDFSYSPECTISGKITELIGQCGENIKLNFECFLGKNLYCYNHHTRRVSSVVDLDADGDLSDFGKEISMHIVASSPISIDRDSIDNDILEKERSVAAELSSSEVNDNIRVRRIEGRINKFFKENVLLEQEWIYDNKKTVGQILKENNVQKVNFFKIVKL